MPHVSYKLYVMKYFVDRTLTIDIIMKNMNINTKFCSDNNERQEFKCECNDGFEGTRCEIGR